MCAEYVLLQRFRRAGRRQHCGGGFGTVSRIGRANELVVRSLSWNEYTSTVNLFEHSHELNYGISDFVMSNRLK